jgi:outer membrane protein insertion porin family
MKQWFLLFPLLLLGACSGLKHLPNDDFLFQGAQITLENKKTIEQSAELRAELAEVLYPKPNTRLLWQYPGVLAHARANREKAGWLAKKMNSKWGEKPVLLSDVPVLKIQSLLENRLENKGYFDHQVELKLKKKNKKARLLICITLGEPYRMSEYQWLGADNELSSLLKPQLHTGPWQPGKRYDLTELKDERERLNNHLKNNGYYAFSADYLIFSVDTNLGNRRFNMYLSLKTEIPNMVAQAFTLRNIRVYPNQLIESDSSRLELSDTTREAGMLFIEGRQTTFLPRHLQRYIVMKPGDLYQRRQELATANRLSSLGIYRFVNLRFHVPPGDSGSIPVLDLDISLSPANKRRLRYETQFLSKSNNFVGPALKAGYQNRNLFRGGELLNLDANFGFETQFAGGRQTGLNAFEVGLKSELMFPRILSPVSLGDQMAHGLANTRISLGISFLNRVQFYRLRAVQAGFGYQWRTNRFVSHDWQPLNLSFTSLSRTTPDFENILGLNPFLRESFDQRFIAGMAYQFVYNEKSEAKPHRWMVLLSLDASGNLPGLLTGNDQFFGESISQYIRVDADIRHHWVFSDTRRLVLRTFAGFGYSYGNSFTLPYIKQYFAGGPNSVRGFNIRSLGPGAYRPFDFDVASFFDQTGDIKIEGNVEYQFPLFSYLKGAWFIDAGNVWLQRFNPRLRGGHFTPNWYNELGVGAGFGLRIDLDLLVLRFDLGTPLRKPWLPAGGRWLDSFNLNERDWRRENLNLVFAIGYPF